MDLKGRAAVVTGSGRGIGRALALEFARHGASVVCCARTEKDIQQTATLIEAEGGQCLPVQADVADRRQVDDMVGQAMKQFGRVDVLFNNAARIPVIGALWIRLGARNPSIPVKFAMGLVLLGSGFFVLAWGSTFTSGDRLVSPMWLVVTYFLHTVGELCLSPVGLSSITKLAPRHLVGQMMGTWFMGSALGNLIAGQAAGFIESMPLPRLFGTVALASAGAGLLLFVFSKPIRRMIGPVR